MRDWMVDVVMELVVVVRMHHPPGYLLDSTFCDKRSLTYS